MKEKKEIEVYPKNPPGAFYVENSQCIACGVAEYWSPDLMDHDNDEMRGYHCYFKSQPATLEELDQAIRAVWSSCCAAVKYGGNDPYVIQRLSELEAEGRIKAEPKPNLLERLRYYLKSLLKLIR